MLQKRDPRRTRRSTGRVALVLAGGAVSGGAYKIGGLRALDELFAGRRTGAAGEPGPGRGGTRPFGLTDFDLFVGVSAGSVLASVLAVGITPDESLRVVLGDWQRYRNLTLSEFMAPNWREPIERLGWFFGREQEFLTNWLSGATDPRTGAPYRLRKTLAKMLGALPGLAPNGLFTTDRVAAYLERNLAQVGIPDSMAALWERRRKGLYLGAIDVNRGELVVFGHDEPYSGVPISQAICASCALPGFYRPVRVENPRHGLPGEPPFLDLVDGAIVRTANLRVAVEKGAELIVCYNPFTRIRYERAGRSLVDHGPFTLASQLLRLLLGSRLDVAKELLYHDDSVDADFVFVEPSDDDLAFFAMNPLDWRAKQRAAHHGYHSVRDALQANHDLLAGLFETHGIEVHPPDIRRQSLHPPRGARVYLDERETRGPLVHAAPLS